MKRHELSFYEKGLDGNDFPAAAILPWIGQAVTAMFLLFSAAEIPWTPWLIIAAVWFVTTAVHTTLYNTSIYRLFDRTDTEIWNNFKELDKDTQRRVGLTPAILDNMSRYDSGSYREIARKIENLVEIQRERDVANGPGHGIKQALDIELDVQKKELELTI